MVNLKDLGTDELEKLAAGASAEAMRRRFNEADRRPMVDMGKSPDTWRAEDRASRQEIAQQGAAGAYLPEPFTMDNLEAWMTFQPWDRDQVDNGTQVREALTHAAKTIFRVVPRGLFRDEAIQLIIRCRMVSNAAISFRGRF
jgi:hypothetical protein